MLQKFSTLFKKNPKVIHICQQSFPRLLKSVFLLFNENIIVLFCEKKDEAKSVPNNQGAIKPRLFMCIYLPFLFANGTIPCPASINQIRSIRAPATTPKNIRATITPAKILAVNFLFFITISSQFIFYYLRNILKSDE